MAGFFLCGYIQTSGSLVVSDVAQEALLEYQFNKSYSKYKARYHKGNQNNYTCELTRLGLFDVFFCFSNLVKVWNM